MVPIFSLNIWHQAQLELQELHTSTQMLQRPTILPQRRPSNYNSLAKSMSTPTHTTWHKTLSSSTKNLLLLVQRTGIAEDWSLGSWLEHFCPAIFSLEPQSQLLPAWREISIRWGSVICGDIACPWSLLLINPIQISQNDYWTYNPTTERSVVKTYSPFHNSVSLDFIEFQIKRCLPRFGTPRPCQKLPIQRYQWLSPMLSQR